jgi:GTP diphosphokinase / guanosine-3',5'-bis(diphosphate) 3'-diphosphatase
LEVAVTAEAGPLVPGAGDPSPPALPGTAASRPARPAERAPSRLSRPRLRGRRDEPPEALEPLLRAHRAAHPRSDPTVLRRAYQVAEQLHHGQARHSGEPYITHPLAVATMLAALGVDTTTLAAALLHDTVEDTVYTLERAREEFGDEVAHLVDGVTKLDKMRFGEAAEAETIRKMILAMSRDLRVLVIKLADRVHNMRTLRFQPRHKQERIARATLDVLVPLADRLGIQVFKRELEDLAFATLEPEAYAAITEVVAERAAERDAYLSEVIAKVEPALREAGVKATLSARPKHLFSVHHTLLERGEGEIDFYDVARVLVIVSGEAPACYVAMGAVHSRWKPVPGRFKDFIAMPKFNLYQSLHTTVIGPHDALLQVLVRTEEMHRTAEHGIVAFLDHNHGGRQAKLRQPAGGRPDELEWLRRMVSWQRDAPDPGQFLESLRYDLSDHEVVLFTPKGDSITLPEGATPVDFAYALGTDTGHRCVGARVNGQLMPLASALSDGDVVEVLTTSSRETGPSRDWLASVKTPRAQLKVRQWFTERRRDLAIAAGKQAVGYAMREAGRELETAIVDGSLARTAVALRYATLDDLFEAVGETIASPAGVVQQLLSTP